MYDLIKNKNKNKNNKEKKGEFKVTMAGLGNCVFLARRLFLIKIFDKHYN